MLAVCLGQRWYSIKISYCYIKSTEHNVATSILAEKIIVVYQADLPLAKTMCRHLKEYSGCKYTNQHTTCKHFSSNRREISVSQPYNLGLIHSVSCAVKDRLIVSIYHNPYSDTFQYIWPLE